MPQTELSRGALQHRPAREQDRLLVLILEPRQMLRQALACGLSKFGLEPICSGSADEFRNSRTGQSRPDLAIVCVPEGKHLPRDVTEVVGDSEELRSVPVVVISNDRSPSQLHELLQAGMRGFLPTSMDLAVAVEALWLVKAGGLYFPVNDIARMAEPASGTQLQGEAFTPRQRQVIEAIRKGKPNKIIAYELNMCESTVKVHVRTIMKKLKAKNRTQIVYMYSSQESNSARD